MKNPPVYVYDLSDLKKIPVLIRRMEKLAAGSTVKPLRQWGMYMQAQTERAFNQGGRTPHKWKALSKMTLALREYHGVGGTKPLVASGAAKKSIKTKMIHRKGTRAMMVYTTLNYMKVHQRGGKTKKTVIKAKVADYLRFEIGGEVFYRKSVTIPPKKIPQRKFLFINAGDRKVALQMMQKQLKHVLETQLGRGSSSTR